MRKLILVVAVVLLWSVSSFAQGASKISKVDPDTAKVGANITVVGENLSKGTVVAVFLSIGESDFKASLVDQTAEKIILKIPQVKPGKYNVSIQVKNEIYIQPVFITIEQ